MRNQLRFIWLFAALFCPFQFSYFSWKDQLFIQTFQKICNSSFDFHSDSLELWLSLPLLMVLGWSISILLKNKIGNWKLEEFTAWAIAIVLLFYGADKVKMEQFPSPEVNLLFKPLHEFDKDLLFWTSMGTSKWYNFVTGCIEILLSILLIFPASRKIGWMFTTASFAYIFLLNLSFDISVKAFLSFLLLISILESTPSFQRVFIYLWDRQKKKHHGIFIRIVTFNILAVIALYGFNSSHEIEEHVYDFRSGKLFITRQGYWIEKYEDGSSLQAKIIHQKDNEYWLLLSKGERVYRMIQKEKDEAFSTSSLFNRKLILNAEVIPQIEDPLTFVSP